MPHSRCDKRSYIIWLVYIFWTVVLAIFSPKYSQQTSHSWPMRIRYMVSCNFNSLAPGRSECDSKTGIFNLVSLIGIFRSSDHNGLRWMPEDLTDDQSTLVQVMAWCRQATSHHLNQCWPRSLPPYDITRPQWVKVWFMFCLKLPCPYLALEHCVFC